MILFKLDGPYSHCMQPKCSAFVKFDPIPFIDGVVKHYQKDHPEVWKMVVLAEIFEVQFLDEIWQYTPQRDPFSAGWEGVKLGPIIGAKITHLVKKEEN